MKLNDENKNYINLINLAEGAYLRRNYLEAFLIQSCVIEGVIKNYAEAKLFPIISNSNTLNNKFRNFELARLTDELFITNKIPLQIYENLNEYRKKRNDVIHNLLEISNEEKRDSELKIAYELGKGMKNFIVDDLVKEEKGVTLAELLSQIEQVTSELNALSPKEEQIIFINKYTTSDQLIEYINDLTEKLNSLKNNEIK